MSVWRDIWKQTIIASQTAILKRNENKYTSFRELESEYPTDAMVHLEKAMSLEIQKKYGEAEKEYEKAIKLDTVPHWIEVTEFFLKRCREKKAGRFFYDYDDEEELNGNMVENDIFNVQWTAFYDLHNYVYLSNHVRYLSISSMARIDSETEMAAIVFRSCMEETLKEIFPNAFIEESAYRHNSDLYTAIDKLFAAKQLSQRQCSHCHFIRKAGNDATHKETSYKDSDIIDLAVAYDKLMCFLNNLCKERFLA